MRNRLHDWMQDKHVQIDEPIRKKWDKLYDSNREYIFAVDHALQGGVGFGLAAFACGRIPGPLQKGQKRVLVPADKLPPSVATAKGFKQRAVVADDEGNKQLEVSWCPDRRVLFDVADCGAIGYYSKFWLYNCNGAGLRGCFFGDMPHTRYNRFKTSVKKAGMWSAWLEGSVLIGLRKGPWSGAAHFHTLQTAADNLFVTSDTQDPLFAFCFSRIVQYLYKGKPVPNITSEAGMEEVWSQGTSCPLWYRKGSRQKSSRWFQWVQEMDSMSQWFGYLLMVALRICIERQWWKSIEDTPLFDGVGAVVHDIGDEEHDEPLAPERDAPAMDAAEAAEGANPSPEAAAEELQKQRKKVKNTVHLAAKIMCNDTSLTLINCIRCLGKFSWDRSTAFLKETKSLEGGAQWFAQDRIVYHNI